MLRAPQSVVDTNLQILKHIVLTHNNMRQKCVITVYYFNKAIALGRDSCYFRNGICKAIPVFFSFWLRHSGSCFNVKKSPCTSPIFCSKWSVKFEFACTYILNSLSVEKKNINEIILCFNPILNRSLDIPIFHVVS